MTVAPAVVSASVVKPTFVSCEPSPVKDVAATVPSTVTPVAVVWSLGVL